ncbi:FtsX-like permease family protein [Ruminococcus flavefaciens]|uniref:FtsX-like permease family protein n=1 Tax=Ruminococcus flavefaciens TaxID=1265 RepID=UPI00046423C0|nr:ABC transporter permease [Ruminococcus flavefaciens]
MAVFALIIMAICIIMIIFTINNNISRDIVNIGALRAVGYTVGQIRAALTAEYVIIGAVGSAVGIALSYLVFPAAEKMFIREICGIVWKKRFYPVITPGVLVGMLAVMMCVSYFSTRKIKKLHPATALRFGLKSNSFKKNHFPLSETKGELNILLALKSSMQNMGQKHHCILYYNGCGIRCGLFGIIVLQYKGGYNQFSANDTGRCSRCLYLP